LHASFVLLSFLADRILLRSTIGYWHDTVVCLSVCDDVYCGAQGRYIGAESCYTVAFLAGYFLFTVRTRNIVGLYRLKRRVAFAHYIVPAAQLIIESEWVVGP